MSIDINSARAHARLGHRDHRDQHQPRGGGRDRAPAAHPRHRRPDRHRLHRHGVDQEPARRRRPAARCDEDGPRAHPDRAAVALRPAGDVAPAPAALARRVEPPRLPALRRHRQHPQRRVAGAVDPAPDRRGSAQGPHRARDRCRCRWRWRPTSSTRSATGCASSRTRATSRSCIVPNPHMQTPEYSIRRVRDDEAGLAENTQLSYQIPQRPEVADPSAADKKPAAEPAAVLPLMPSTTAPASAVPPSAARQPGTGTSSGGLFGWLKRMLVGDSAPAPAETRPALQHRDGRAGGQRHSRDDRRDRGRDRGGSRNGERPGHQRRDGSHRDEPRRAEGRRDGRRDEPRRDEPRRDEPRRDEPRRDEPRRDEGRREIEIRTGNGPGVAGGAPPSGAEASGPRPEGERGGRSRRGGRRRRRGGGGGRDGMTTGSGADSGSPTGESFEPAATAEGGPAGGGSPAPEPRPAQFDFGPAPAAAPAPSPAAAPAPVPASTPAQAPTPAAADATTPGESRPHVVWSSAPAQTNWSPDSRRED